MLRGLPYRLARWAAGVGALAAIAATTVIAAPSAGAAERVYDAETTAECVLAPGEQVIGPLETSCTEPNAKPLATVPIVHAEPPTVTSVSPNEVGSAGNFKVTIKGTNFEGVTGVKYGTVPATKIITTGTPTKGQCKVKSATELECATPFHEHGKAHTTVTNASGTSTESAADEITFWPEVYRNEVAVGTSHIPGIGYGEIDLESPQSQTAVECVSLSFGSAWNEARMAGAPVYGRGELLVWWAGGHTPSGEYTELSSKCRFVYHGTEQTQPTSPVVWATAEPPLHVVTQEAILCRENHALEVQCPRTREEESEFTHETVIRSLTREAPSTPWNMQLTERAGVPRVQIGLPEECKNKTGPERAEPARCPEPSEREPGINPQGCNLQTPAPPGCMALQILSNAPLNLHIEYEGFLEPVGLDQGPTGLIPSSMEFEGHAKGEPSLRLRETPSTEGSVTGSVKILGFSGQELLTVK
jgi:IPT/TIG domain